MAAFLLFFFLTAAYLLFVTVSYFRRKVRKVSGPPRPSFLLGHEWIIRQQDNVSDLKMSWYHQYGTAYRIGGCFGQDVLVVSDPKALQYIFHMSGYRFPKVKDSVRAADAFFGPGLATVGGSVHQRQRKILNGSFSASQLRKIFLLFQSSASLPTDKLNDQIKSGPRVLNAVEWTSKVALDIIGMTSFRYRFEALNGGQTELRDALDNLITDSQMHPRVIDLLFMALWRMLPDSILNILSWIPSKDTRRLMDFKDVTKKIARNIFKNQLAVVSNGKNAEEKDMVNVLALSYLSDEDKKKMSNDEIESQLATFILAGHDTTANAIAWLLYELARHPDDQIRIRDEIRQVQLSEEVLTSNDYDSMPFLNAAIKETLRRHPFVHTLYRMADQDDVLPLSEPVTTTDGRVATEIPISKGQVISASLYTYNHLPTVWGNDADRWNPGRFLDSAERRQLSLGVYSNLYAHFSSSKLLDADGSDRMTVMEIQTVIVELLSKFEFKVPVGVELLDAPGTQSCVPIVKGQLEDGVQVPLQVAPLET
ncbi:cytochrome P450 [Desarmillaria tabescens]|uniref:Cytochrome P450 n=1 Tax=Armillaria tabescens TaxID=1929756 RepID=A0AA39JM77_ARMTA|nr:cytochrome P450 [Desarmillaria tabescens]KAK0445342.1 cytochrome P450 [Desarmillaria tabescens]